jgi:hypothetical protein
VGSTTRPVARTADRTGARPEEPSLRRSLVLPVGIVASALLFALAVGPWISLRGVAGPVIAMSERPAFAALATLGCLAVGIAIAAGVGRLINAVVGMFALGCGLGILAMRAGTVEDLAFSGAAAGATLRGMAIETLLWAVAIGAASVVTFRISGPLPDAVEVDDPRLDGPFGRNAFLALAAGLVVLPAAWLLALSPMKGQALGAVVVGSMLAGLGGRLLAPRVAPVLLFAAPCLAAALGQAVLSTIVPAAAPIGDLYVAQQIPRIAVPMPIDWAAGGTAGIALGIGWSRSFLKTEPERRPRRR